MSAADLIVSGVDVMADDEENDARAWSELRDLICEAGGATDCVEAAGLREVVRMLRDAATSAIDVHEGAPDVDMVTMGRMRRFSVAMTTALKEIT